MLTLVLLLCVTVDVSSAQRKKSVAPPELDYHVIPFGKTEAEVLAWLELQPGVIVSKDENVNINNFLSYQPIAPFFTGGVRQNEQQQSVLHSSLVKKYIVRNSSAAFPGTFNVELYFVRNASYFSEYKLFVVWCMSRVEAGSMRDIYTKELEKRIERLGTPSDIWESTTFFGTYHMAADSTVVLSPTGSYTTSVVRPQSANVTLWQMDEGAAFFMMTDNRMLQFKEYLFVYSDGWGQYLKALAEVQTPLSERFMPQPANKK